MTKIFDFYDKNEKMIQKNCNGISYQLLLEFRDICTDEPYYIQNIRVNGTIEEFTDQTITFSIESLLEQNKMIDYIKTLNKDSHKLLTTSYFEQSESEICLVLNKTKTHKIPINFHIVDKRTIKISNQAAFDQLRDFLLDNEIQFKQLTEKEYTQLHTVDQQNKLCDTNIFRHEEIIEEININRMHLLG